MWLLIMNPILFVARIWMLDIFDSTNLEKLNSFLLQYWLHFHINSGQFNIDIVKVNFTMSYLTRVVQSWFEIRLGQKDQKIYQNWCQVWFIPEVKVYEMDSEICRLVEQPQLQLILCYLSATWSQFQIREISLR